MPLPEVDLENFVGSCGEKVIAVTLHFPTKKPIILFIREDYLRLMHGGDMYIEVMNTLPPISETRFTRINPHLENIEESKNDRQ